MLLDQGWAPTTNPGACDLLLIDHDDPMADPRPDMIKVCHENGGKVVVYPHGANPTVVFYDGVYPPDPRIAARLEHGPGSVEIGRRFTIDDLRQHVVGWTYTDTAPYRAPDKLERVLFAPLHPNGRGELAAYDRETNRRVYADLLNLPVRLSVRTIAHPMLSGLWEAPNVEWLPAYDFSMEETQTRVDEAEVVIGAGTFAFTAVARGKPTVMLPDRNLIEMRGFPVPAHEELYRDYLKYPLEYGDRPLMELLDCACHESPVIRDWADLFIGEQCDPAELSTLLAGIVSG